MDDRLAALILGLVQGLTEFLPVSSTAHLILVSDVLKLDAEKSSSFLEQVLSYPQPYKGGQDIKLLDALRTLRNKADYSGDPVSDAVAREALDEARRLVAEVREWIKANRPELI